MQAVGQILADPDAALAMRVVLTELDPRRPSMRRLTLLVGRLTVGERDDDRAARSARWAGRCGGRTGHAVRASAVSSL